MVKAKQLIDIDVIASSAKEMIKYGQIFYARNWNLATSSNYSAVLCEEPLKLLMTASGKHKGELTESDFVIVDETLRRVEDDNTFDDSISKPSAEAALHIAIAKIAGVRAVLHTHSVWSTIVSERYFPQGYVELRDHEMLKALTGVNSHEAVVRVAILENSQDMISLGQKVSTMLNNEKIKHAFLLKGHGLYTWASSLSAARNQVEALEFLFEVVGRKGN